MSVSNSRAEEAVRQFLISEGYDVSSPRLQGQTGVDLIATRDNECLHIEVIGYSGKPPKRALDFFQAFFRAVSRLKDGATSCVIALPKQYRRGLPKRAAQYGPAWNRIGDAFPELSVWLVDCEPGACSVAKYSWNDCANVQGT